MSCVIMYKRAGEIDLLGRDQEYGFSPTEFLDRADALKTINAACVGEVDFSEVDWWEIVPLPAKPVSPAR